MIADVTFADIKPLGPESEALPEVQVYLGLLVLIYLIDQKFYEKALELALSVTAQIQQSNRRTMDVLGSSAYFYLARVYELLGRMSECRKQLLIAHRNASLRHDSETEAVLINLILRNYLHYNLIEQADNFATKTEFPETAGNNQLARYMYYLGRIKALQLDYTASHRHLMQAIRKAPQGNLAVGFQQAVYKLSIIVQLLIGEIPDRSVFVGSSSSSLGLKNSLVPYYHITQAVRTGDLSQFQNVLSKYQAKFLADKTWRLILRLRHNVIKAGLRKICMSYSRISLRDICMKLHLDSEEDAEYIVAKAIKDGVIDGGNNGDAGWLIDHANGNIVNAAKISAESRVRGQQSGKLSINSHATPAANVVDIYSTDEPQYAFHQRISFCLDLYNESVKAMRYDYGGDENAAVDGKNKGKFGNDDDDNEDDIDRELAAELEEAAAMEEDDDEDGLGGDEMGGF